MSEFILAHLDFFTIEMLMSEFTNEIIPKLIEDMNKEGINDSNGYKVLE